MYGHLTSLPWGDQAYSSEKVCSRNATLPTLHVPLPITPYAAWHEGYLRLSLTPRGYVCLAECNHRDIQVEVVTTARVLEQGSLDATDWSSTLSTRWLVRDTRSCSCCVFLACDRH